MRFLIKTLVSALIIAGASELARRRAWMGAILVSLPMSSILVLTWLYLESHDVAKVADLSLSILWAIVPSTLFFIILPILIKKGLSFPIAMVSSCIMMVFAYGAFTYVYRLCGIRL